MHGLRRWCTEVYVNKKENFSVTQSSSTRNLEKDRHQQNWPKK